MNTKVKNLRRRVIPVTTDYTVTEFDGGSMIVVNSASQRVVTIPSSLTLPIGTEIHVLRRGAGNVVINGALLSVNGGNAIANQNGVVRLIKTTATTWYLLGDLSFIIDTDANALAYITAVETADGQALEIGVRNAIHAFVIGCKADGIWDAIKASCILAGARTRLGALTPLVGTAPTSFNFVDADYNRKTGLIGNGSTKRLVANRAGNADPQNNRHISTYIGAVGAKTTLSLLICDAVNGNEAVTHLAINPGSGNFSTRASNTPGDSSNLYNGVGFYGLSRIASDSYTARGNTTSRTITRASETPPPDSYGIFVRSKSVDGAINQFYDGRLAFYSIGESLNLALLDTRVTNLMNAFNAAIP